MPEIRTRPMTTTEWDALRAGLVREYAAEHVRAGNWTEEEAARHRVGAIGLNVFGSNAVARGLYASAGYEITAMNMRKELVPDPEEGHRR